MKNSQGTHYFEDIRCLDGKIRYKQKCNICRKYRLNENLSSTGICKYCMRARQNRADKE